MAAIVVGHWELSWNTPIKEAELWNLPIRDFGLTDWRMWPVSGIVHHEQAVTLTEYPNFQSILADLDDAVTRVFVEPNSEPFVLDSVSLPDFKHPENVAYIFGSAHFNPTISNMRDQDLAVTVPTVLNDGVLWPHQCLVTIMYDRLVKSWQ